MSDHLLVNFHTFFRNGFFKYLCLGDLSILYMLIQKGKRNIFIISLYIFLHVFKIHQPDFQADKTADTASLEKHLNSIYPITNIILTNNGQSYTNIENNKDILHSENNKDILHNENKSKIIYITKKCEHHKSSRQVTKWCIQILIWKKLQISNWTGLTIS